MKDFKPFIYTAFVVVVLWVLSIFLLNGLIGDDAEKAQFGDSFGAINALFSGLAFAGIIATILLQRKELILQREELKLTREELFKSAEAQDKSQKALNLQVSLMTKQAVLSAYQSRYSANLDLLASRSAGTPQQRLAAHDELFILNEKISLIIKDVEDENSKYNQPL